MMNMREFVLFKKTQEMLFEMESNYVLINDGLTLYSVIREDLALKREFSTIEETYDFVFKSYLAYLSELLIESMN